MAIKKQEQVKKVKSKKQEQVKKVKSKKQEQVKKVKEKQVKKVKSKGINLVEEWEKVKREKKEKSLPKVEATEILKQEKAKQELEGYKKKEINWLDGDFYDSWDKVKGHTKNLMGHKKEYNPYDDEDWKPFFLAHSQDEISGKPQLVDNVRKTIPLIRWVLEKKKDETEIQSFYFFDEKYDKRYDGYQKDCFMVDFLIYRIIQDGKEYYLWTQERIPNEVCDFKGMLVELDDLTELNRNLKIKSVSKVFFVKEFKPNVRILTKEQLITYTKERKITEDDWFLFLAKNKRFETYNFFPKETEYLKSAVILSGKKDGYPLHLFILGPAGTNKTMGIVEAIASKFSEEPYICEASNSRLKGLEPSFKEKPANIGFLANAHRVAFIDELLKMVESESQKSHSPINNMLGNLNFLLEHKARSIFSGFDTNINVQASAKVIAVSNPISNKPTIYSHIGIVCPTFMSRGLWYVQDKEEQDFVSKEGLFRVPKVPRTPTQEYIPTNIDIFSNKNIKKSIFLKMCSGEYVNISQDEFLCLFDTCYSFVCDLEEEKINQLVNLSTQLAKEPMKTSVWKPRAFHHIYLLVDGLCKHRCLFKDYDSTFTPKQEDYDLAETILVRMVKGWDTDLSPKENFR